MMQIPETHVLNILTNPACKVCVIGIEAGMSFKFADVELVKERIKV